MQEVSCQALCAIQYDTVFWPVRLLLWRTGELPGAVRIARCTLPFAHCLMALLPGGCLIFRKSGLEQAEDTNLDSLTVVGVADIEQMVTTVYLHVW